MKLSPVVFFTNSALDMVVNIIHVCVQSQMGHALAQGQRNQGQPEFTSSP